MHAGPDAKKIARAMTGGEDAVAPDVLSDFLVGVVSRTSEMAMPVVARLVGELARRGHRSGADAMIVEGARVFSPWIDGNRLLLAVDLPGEAGLSTLTLVDLERFQLPRRMRVCAHSGDMTGSLEKMQAGNGRAAGMFSDVGKSFEVPGRSGWMHASSGRAYHDVWAVHFGLVDTAMRSIGLGSAVDETKTAYLSRRWIDPSEGRPGLEGHAAAFGAAMSALSIDEGLPGAEAEAFMRDVVSAMLAMDMDRIADDVSELADGSGDAPASGRDDHGTSGRVSDPDGEGVRTLRLSGRGFSMTLRSSADGSRREFRHVREGMAVPGIGSDLAAASAVFFRTAEGHECRIPPGSDMDVAWAWNAFLYRVADVLSLLREKDASVPGP